MSNRRNQVITSSCCIKSYLQMEEQMRVQSTQWCTVKDTFLASVSDLCLFYPNQCFEGCLGPAEIEQKTLTSRQCLQ